MINELFYSSCHRKYIYYIAIIKFSVKAEEQYNRPINIKVELRQEISNNVACVTN